MKLFISSSWINGYWLGWRRDKYEVNRDCLHLNGDDQDMEHAFFLFLYHKLEGLGLTDGKSRRVIASVKPNDYREQGAVVFLTKKMWRRLRNELDNIVTEALKKALAGEDPLKISFRI